MLPGRPIWDFGPKTNFSGIDSVSRMAHQRVADHVDGLPYPGPAAPGRTGVRRIGPVGRRRALLALALVVAVGLTAAVLRPRSGGPADLTAADRPAGSSPAGSSPTASTPTSSTAGASSTPVPASGAPVGDRAEPVRLAQAVAPLAAPPGKPPQAQYQEIHADCGVTRHGSDDPIVFPGVPGASHNHTFVGNATTDANTTPASLATGATSCEDSLDRSAYWMPTLYQHGSVVDPSTVTIYYKSGVDDYRTVRPFPPGFRIVVGSPKTPDVAHFQGDWRCGEQVAHDFLPSCPAGSALIVHLKAPSCWDGSTLDSVDHSSHLVFPVNGVCPAAHPVALPMLEIKVSYLLPGGRTDGLAYSSGASYTFHYDFMNGWDQARLAELTRHCINEGRQCNGYGIDQHKP
jgi:Domain of unknown function (DUF1996)